MLLIIKHKQNNYKIHPSGTMCVFYNKKQNKALFLRHNPSDRSLS